MVSAMNCSSNNRPDVVVAAFGSPHGDDQAGWQVIDTLQKRTDLPARIVAIREATELIEELDGCRKLIVVDACCAGDQSGTLSRFEWPDPRIEQQHCHSTHGMGVCAALRLAERLGRLPPCVEIFGIEVRDCEPGHEMSFEVWEAVKELEAVIYAELCQTACA